MKSRWAITGAGCVFAYIFILSYISQINTDYSVPFTIAPTVPPHRYAKRVSERVPCSWADEAKGLCKIDLGDDLMVGVVTYHGAHANKIETLKKSWMKDYLLGKSVFVISDEEDKENSIIDTRCSDRLEGLSCKTVYLFQKLYEKNPNAKWFLRAMDDTYVHLPNLLDYLGQFDETVPLFIGMRQVLSPVNQYQRFEESQGPQYRPNELFYPQGGCGWVLSNEYVKRMLMPENLVALDWFFYKYAMIDDLGFGEFSEKHMRIAMISTRGFSHIAWTRDNCPANYQCPQGPRVPSNITFLTVHAREQWADMPGLHSVFVNGDFTAEYLPSVDKENHNDWALWKMCQCTDNETISDSDYSNDSDNDNNSNDSNSNSNNKHNSNNNNSNNDNDNSDNTNNSNNSNEDDTVIVNVKDDNYKIETVP